MKNKTGDWFRCGLTQNFTFVRSDYNKDTHSAHAFIVASTVPFKFLFSTALFIWSYRFEPVQSIRSSNHVRLGLRFPRLPSIFLRRVS